MSLSPEDTRRLADSAAELDAAADLDALTAVPALRDALAYTRDRLAAARTTLADALGADGASEAVQARRDASEYARKSWRYVRGVIEHHLLNPPPEIVIDADEQTRREALLRTLSPLQPSALMKPARLIEQLGTLRAAIDSPTAADDLEGLDFATLRATLDAAVEQLEAAVEAAAAQEQPSAGAARAALDDARALHAMMVAVALRDAGRLDERATYLRGRAEPPEPERRPRRAGTRVVTMGRR